MRKQLPFWWMVQAPVLAILGALIAFFPHTVLEVLLDDERPRDVPWPENALYQWVLSLEEIPSAPLPVRQAFFDHDQLTHPDADVWYHDDEQGYLLEWELMQSWLLEATPSAPPEVVAWILAIDQAPDPDDALVQWVAEHRSTTPPSRELKAWILELDQVEPKSWRIAADLARESGLAMIIAALFTLFGLLSPGIRRSLARTFMLVFIFWGIALFHLATEDTSLFLGELVVYIGFFLALTLVVTFVRPSIRATWAYLLLLMVTVWWALLYQRLLQWEPSTGVLLLFSSAGFLVLMNGYYWLIGPHEDPPQDDAGIAQERPAQLWGLWVVQFLAFMTVGLLCYYDPDEGLRWLTNSDHDHLGVHFADDQMRIMASWHIAQGLFSYFALGVAKDWIWRGFGWLFALGYGLFAVSLTADASSGEYSYWLYVLVLIGLVFAPLNIWFVFRRTPWFAENVEKDVRGWRLGDFRVGGLMLLRGLFSRRRPAHKVGVGASGTFRLAQQTDPLLVELHIPDRLPVQVRFSNRSHTDDAALDFRGCAVKFSDHPEDSPLDLKLTTGSFAPFRNLVEFARLTPGLTPLFWLRRALRASQQAREGYAAGMRRAPDSFAHLSYYLQVVRHLVGPDNLRYLVQVRLIPDRPAAEEKRGLPTESDMVRLWHQDRDPSDDRPRDYLRRELKDRLERGPVVFRLQLQLHEPAPTDSLAWYDPGVDWDEHDHPWRDLGTIELTEALTDKETEQLVFDSANHPLSMGIPKASNVWDVRSIGAAEPRISRALVAMRAWRQQPFWHRWFGIGPGRVERVRQQTHTRRQVRARGHADGMAVAIMEVLEARFGEQPPEMVTAIDAIDDPVRLRQLTRTAAVVGSLEAFVEALQSGGTPSAEESSS